MDRILLDGSRLGSKYTPSVDGIGGCGCLPEPMPIGTALQLSGTQQVTTLTVSAQNRSVSGRQYGDVSVSATTYNRNHNGGTNG